MVYLPKLKRLKAEAAERRARRHPRPGQNLCQHEWTSSA